MSKSKIVGMMVLIVFAMGILLAGEAAAGEKGKYLLLWEVDQTRTPVSPKERVTGWNASIAMVKEDIKKGITKDWGAFVGELNGYVIVEGTEVEIHTQMTRYSPFVRMKVHPILSLSQLDEVMKNFEQMIK